MPVDTHIGDFEEVVLLAVCGIGEYAYAVNIREHIDTVGGRSTTVGNVYRSLSRLEEKGLLKSKVGSAQKIRGGKPKRFYTITGSGVSAIKAVRQTRARLWEQVDLNSAISA